ncbi:MAG: 30S ribosomal protein S4 [Parcubacteria group bacterium]|nr:30S ribosomal protein S4 [Parcubacteria group bacterium]
MTDSKCKICRRAGEKLFLKGDRCFTPKCAFERKPYAPGKRDSERKHRSTVTEFGLQLREKQKVRNVYRVSEKQFANYVKRASALPGNPSENLFEGLERRLDSIVYRLGFAKSRSESRQIVAHGHILVNGRRVTVPSYNVNVGDILAVRSGSLANGFFAHIAEKTAKAAIPLWINFDAKKNEAEVRGKPVLDKGSSEYNLTSVIEFYSR